MSKNSISILCLLSILTSCATVQDYSSTQLPENSKITMVRDIEGPLLGTSTFVYKLAAPRDCQEGANIQEDKRFMTLDKINPLIKQLNENGVSVDPNTPLLLRIQSVAGPIYNCTLQVSFVPSTDKNYEIKLLGRIDASPHQCKAELWSAKKGGDGLQKENFENYDECRPK